MSNSLADELLADVAEEESNAMDNEKKHYSSILYNGESSHAGPDESVRADSSMQYVDESHAHGASQPGNELESLQNNEKEFKDECTIYFKAVWKRYPVRAS